MKAFSARQIDDAGIRSVQNVIDLTPNASFDHSFTYRNSFLTIRGISQINNADPPVAVVIDGVPQNNQKQLRINLFDVERIEILKGPQGALYGRNAIGGAINIETKAPKHRFESFAGLEYGSGGDREIFAGASGPLAEGKAMFRLVAQLRHADGMLDNDFLGRKIDGIGHDNSVRGKLALYPRDGLRLDFQASLNDFSGGSTWDSVVRSGDPNDIVTPRSNLPGRTKGSSRDVSVKAEAAVGMATLTAITAYTRLEERYRGDLDFSNPADPLGGLFGPLPLQLGQGQNLATRMASQEIRLTSPENTPVRWIAGAYYLKTWRGLETRAFFDTNGSPGQWDDLAANLVRLNEVDHNNAYSVFGQLDYDIAERTTLSGVMRYDRDRRRQSDLVGGGERARAFDAWQPKLTLTRRLGADELVYATYGTGFRSGGFNAPGLPDFRQERLRNVESGYKSLLLNNRLSLSAALFYARSSDFQFFHVDVTSAAQVIGNIDKVDIKGADIDFRYRPDKSLEIDGGLGVADSRIRRNASDSTTVGNRTPKSVPWKLNAGVQYGAHVADGLNSFFRVDYEHRSRKYWHPDNAAVSDALNLVGLRAGLRGEQDKWSVHFFVRNLTNKKYYADYNSARYSGGAVDIGSLAPARTSGVEARLKL